MFAESQRAHRKRRDDIGPVIQDCNGRLKKTTFVWNELDTAVLDHTKSCTASDEMDVPFFISQLRLEIVTGHAQKRSRGSFI